MRALPEASLPLLSSCEREELLHCEEGTAGIYGMLR